MTRAETVFVPTAGTKFKRPRRALFFCLKFSGNRLPPQQMITGGAELRIFFMKCQQRFSLTNNVMNIIKWTRYSVEDGGNRIGNLRRARASNAAGSILPTSISTTADTIRPMYANRCAKVQTGAAIRLMERSRSSNLCHPFFALLPRSI